MSKNVESLWVSSAKLQGLCWELKCGLRDRAVIIAEIDRCISSMADEISMLSQSECDENETVVISAPAAEAEIIPEIPLQESETEVESEAATETEPEQAPESHDEECLTQECQMTAESELMEEAADAEPETLPEPEPIEVTVPEQAAEAVEAVQADEPEPAAETVTETAPEQEHEPAGQTEPTEKPEESQEKKPEPIPLDRKLSRKVMADIRKAFTVNDKFLFRRELFGNSAQQYDEAMNLISEMQSYEEARDYFFGQFGWDSDNREVKRFMEILENHFNC